MDEAIQKMIFKAVDQTIKQAEFDRLQDAIEQDEEVRVEYLRAVTLGEFLGEIASEEMVSANNESARHSPQSTPRIRSVPVRLGLVQLALGAAILIAVGGAAFWLGRQANEAAQVTVGGEATAEESESQIAGHATLRRSVDLQWVDASPAYRDGDVLPNGRLQFEEGVAEIDFFCGATLIVEGPADLHIESDWSVDVATGRLRANVPPAARGFVVKAAGSEIVDLGTEFALEVQSENARVEVIDGEVEIRGGQHDGNHLLTGQRQWLKGTDTPHSFDNLSTLDELILRRDNAASQRFDTWKVYSRDLRRDDRLIAYFPIAGTAAARAVRNEAVTGEDFDGKIVGPVEFTTGRFGARSFGLGFDRLGSRVRTRIDGQFQAFTFACWVKIDRLAHRYNALFMGDGFENGEPHWQIRDDGRLMITVMVDDTQEIEHFSELEDRVVTDAGLHKNYFSDPFWNLSKSGQWFHLVAVYDPAQQRVRQYVNGRVVCDELIEDRLLAKTLRIGPAEIGNWGQPFRKTPQFAVRNLNGTMDELAIFNAALSADEVEKMYEQGKPLGY